jgi:ATP-dependent protease ClpP protease subunit
LKSLPVKVTVNNAGSIESAAVIADLGSSVRVVSPVGRFVFHPWNLDFGAGPRFIPQVKEALHSLEIDQERYKTIFDKTTQAAKTPFDLSPSFNAAMIVNADSAIEHGIAQEIKEPATPSGAVLRWVNQF